MELRWHTILGAILFYGLSSWLLLHLAGENRLTGWPDFIYWLVVTASTVGYGDLSPVTTSGKLIVSIFVIPAGLGLFGLCIGRIAAFVSYQWQKGIKGLKKLNIRDHILIVGWDHEKTPQLIKLLLRESDYGANKAIVLCVRDDISNPFPDKIGFVKVSSYSSEEAMSRAGLKAASCIIIDNEDDDATMTSSLFCAGQNPDAHIIAYFQREELGNLLKHHCPNIECMPSISVEMLAKSAFDPGSSRLHQELLNVDQGMTQYSFRFDGESPLKVSDIFCSLKEMYDATLIGVASAKGGKININPDMSFIIEPGSTIYYIADERILTINWTDFYV